MPAFAPHSTPTTDESWDGAANLARVLTDQPRSYYRRLFAWYDAEGEVGVKSTYKFLHHEVSEDGTPGPANLRACRAIIANLNGARTAPDIPRADYQEVYDHAARHLRDGGWDVPEADFRSLTDEVDLAPPLPAPQHAIEQRAISWRAAADPAEHRIRGIAWVYSEPDVYGDRIAAGAFADSLAEMPEVPFLWHHSAPDVIGIATITDTGRRLLVDARLDPDDPLAHKAARKVAGGYIRGLSIGFEPLDWDLSKGGGRLVTRARLWEVSLVTLGAHRSAVVTRDVDHLVQRAVDRALNDQLVAFLRAFRARLLDTGG